MAFNDTLFQLGMDLTRSSTAQKEDHSRAEFSAEVQDPVTSPVEQSTSTAGTTIFIDLHGAKRLDDIKSAERATRRAVETLGLKLKSLHLDRVAGGGVSGVAVLGSRMCRAEAGGGADGSRQRLRGARGHYSAQTHGLRPNRAGPTRGAKSIAEGSAPEGTGESSLGGCLPLFSARNRCRDRDSPGRGFFMPGCLELTFADARHVFGRLRLYRVRRQKRGAGRVWKLHEQQYR